MKRSRLEDVLRAAGRAPAPPPRPETVDAVEARLTSTHIVHASPTRFRRVPALTIAAALVATIVGLGFVVRNDDSAGVRTEQPPTTAPATTAPASTTQRELDASAATTIPIVTTTTSTVGSHPSTSVASEPTTTVPPATTTTSELATTTTEPHPSTTTTAPTPAHITLTCTTASSPTPTVTCTWTASTDARFDHYRLWKHTADGPAQEVYAGTAREAHDTDVRVGAQLIYEVTALAADSTVLAHGDTRVTCC
ncbi:MAG: hypothetical protein QOD30_161 [Actinomycetota bacterium]|jgi:hypothetical protein|nr:hypothetical protein [Actinomycetota bacterium]